MVLKFIKTAAAALTITTISVFPSNAETFDYMFDISLGMAKIGEMRVQADVNEGRYDVSGALKSTGIVGALYDVSYESRARGRNTDHWNFSPHRYNSVSVEGNDTQISNIRYEGNRVSRVVFDPRKRIPDSATSETNTIDPMTLIYLLVRPVSMDHICGGSYILFDGRKHLEVTYTNPRSFSDGRVECAVTYGGKSSGVALSSVTFEPGDDGLMHISRFAANTNIGTLTARRR